MFTKPICVLGNQTWTSCCWCNFQLIITSFPFVGTISRRSIGDHTRFLMISWVYLVHTVLEAVYHLGVFGLINCINIIMHQYIDWHCLALQSDLCCRGWCFVRFPNPLALHSLTLPCIASLLADFWSNALLGWGRGVKPQSSCSLPHIWM